MIVCGYAFTRDDANIRVLQLQSPHHALVLSENGEVQETSMDDVELDIVLGYWKKNIRFSQTLRKGKWRNRGKSAWKPDG